MEPLLALLLLHLTSASLAMDWVTLCPDLQLQAKVVMKADGMVVVDNKESDVVVKCDNQLGAAKIYDGKDQLLAESFNQSFINSVNVTVWEKNLVKFWKSEKTVKCNDCKVTLVEVKDGSFFRSQCMLERLEETTDLWCNIEDWIENAHKERKPEDFECNEIEKYDFKVPNYEFSYWSKTESEWKKCGGKFNENREIAHIEKNITYMKCEVSENEPSEPLLVRMMKQHKSKKVTSLPYLRHSQKDNCQESTYFLVNQNLEVDSSAQTKIVTLVAFVIVLVLSLVVALVVLVRRSKRGRREVTGKENMVTDSNRDSTIEDLETFVPNMAMTSLERQCSVMLEADSRAEKINLTDQEKNKLIQSSVLDGDPSRSNPALPLMAQPRHLHYDRRFERSKESFDIGYMLGQGQYGAVYVGSADKVYGPEKTKVAIKQAKELGDQNQFYTIIDELKIMSNLKMHPNLVNLLGACTSESHLNEVYLILEYCSHGDLKRFLVANRDMFKACLHKREGHSESRFNSRLLYTWGYSIAKGLEYLSSLQIMHGDLAARNVLVGHNYVAKISDFGLSKMMYYNQDYKKTQRNMIPWAWMATEYLQTGEFNIKSDVWSYGVTLWEIFTLGNKPYGFEPYEEMKQKILKGGRLECPEECKHIAGGRTVYDKIMLPCWASVASARPSFTSIAESLETLLGEEGVREYQDMYTSYMRDLPLLHKETVREETPLPPYPGEGYIQFEAAEVRTGDPSYVEMETAERRDEGYSIQTTSPGGYIALVDIKKK